jgi:uncharacterized protein
MPDTLSVVQNSSTNQFEIPTEHGTAVLRYAREGPNLDLLHTEVPEKLEGHGYAAALAKSALAYAKAEGLKIIPSCPFISTYVRRHPEYASMIATR